MANHFIETLEYEQCNDPDAVYLKVSKSVNKMTLNKVKRYVLQAGWSCRVLASQDHRVYCFYSGSAEEEGAL